MVNPVHVRVELLNQHESTSNELLTKRLPFPIMNDSGKVGVNKMTQDDSAFRMNASSGKVFCKCLMGIIITKIEREVHDQKRKRHRNKEDSRSEWIYV